MRFPLTKKRPFPHLDEFDTAEKGTLLNPKKKRNNNFVPSDWVSDSQKEETPLREYIHSSTKNKK